MILALLALFAGMLLAQSSSTFWLPVWTGTRYTFPRLGPTLVVANNQIDAVPAVAKVRTYGTVLTYDAAAAGWHAPAGSSNLVVYVNGLRYTQGTDYSISSPAGLITALADNMQPASLVVVDYDK